jgi:2,4-dienoyl-CoA reductase-like NADH-dependent reductase (Old Yellow Enzyme family)
MKLLEPLDINGMVIPNRTLVPAMVTRLSGEDGYVTQDIIDRYVRYAEGEIGLIVVEAMGIHSARSGPLLRIGEDRFNDGHRELTKQIHDASDSKVVPQIIHFMKVARSGWRQTIDSLSIEEIDDIIAQFGAAAGRARESGYDGVELHSAHAYTLSSFLSKLNPRRDEYDGRTLEGRLRMFGKVMASVRAHVGDDFPVGVRFLSEECIKDGYTVAESPLIALRMAQLGVDYISLSIGGKFEDAIYTEGEPLYPYTGYSGDRCMPGEWYPPLTNADNAAMVKKFINDHGYDVPVVSAGKISTPEEAEGLLAAGKADIIGMARQHLADPDWPKKVREGRTDDIVKCIWCNVCKQLDEKFKEVHCFLWPKHARQAPPDRAGQDGAPGWGDDEGGFAVALRDDGGVQLTWSRAPEGEVAGYDIYRADSDGEVTLVDAVKGARFVDKTVLGGLSYTYYIRAFDSSGRASPPSNSVRIAPPVPDYAATLQENTHA